MSEFAGLPAASPEAVGFDAERLARIDSTMAGAVERGAVPGTVTVVLRRGQVAHSSVHGYLDIERKTPLQLDSLFRMYSQTKPVTAALTMQLQEEGLFFIDEPITNWLPEFEGRGVAAPLDPLQAVRGQALSLINEEPMRRQITIRDLMTMTSGLPSMGNTPSTLWPFLAQVWEGSGFAPTDLGEADPDKTHEDMVIACAQLPNARQPGAGWEYGFDFDVLTVLPRARQRAVARHTAAGAHLRPARRRGLRLLLPARAGWAARHQPPLGRGGRAAPARAARRFREGQRDGAAAGLGQRPVRRRAHDPRRLHAFRADALERR